MWRCWIPLSNLFSVFTSLSCCCRLFTWLWRSLKLVNSEAWMALIKGNRSVWALALPLDTCWLVLGRCAVKQRQCDKWVRHVAVTRHNWLSSLIAEETNTKFRGYPGYVCRKVPSIMMGSLVVCHVSDDWYSLIRLISEQVSSWPSDAYVELELQISPEVADHLEVSVLLNTLSPLVSQYCCLPLITSSWKRKDFLKNTYIQVLATVRNESHTMQPNA